MASTLRESADLLAEAIALDAGRDHLLAQVDRLLEEVRLLEEEDAGSSAPEVGACGCPIDGYGHRQGCDVEGE